MLPAMTSMRSRCAVSADPEIRILLKRPMRLCPPFPVSATECATGTPYPIRDAGPDSGLRKYRTWLLVADRTIATRATAGCGRADAGYGRLDEARSDDQAMGVDAVRDARDQR